MKILFFTIFLIFTSCFDNNTRKKEINHLLNSINWVLAEDNGLESYCFRYALNDLKSKHCFVNYSDSGLIFIDTIYNDDVMGCHSNFYTENTETNNISEGITIENRITTSNILKINNDTLILKYQKDINKPYSNKIIKYYNDNKHYNNNLILDSIFFIIINHFGNNSFMLKLNKYQIQILTENRIIKKGFYSSKINNIEFDFIQNLVRLVNFNTIYDQYPNLSTDVSNFRLVLYYNQNKTKSIGGYMRDYPNIIKRIGHQLIDLEKSTNLIKIDNQKIKDDFFNSHLELFDGKVHINMYSILNQKSK